MSLNNEPASMVVAPGRPMPDGESLREDNKSASIFVTGTGATVTDDTDVTDEASTKTAVKDTGTAPPSVQSLLARKRKLLLAMFGGNVEDAKDNANDNGEGGTGRDEAPPTKRTSVSGVGQSTYDTNPASWEKKWSDDGWVGAT